MNLEDFLMSYDQAFGTFRENMRGVPVTVDYQYIDAGECGSDATVLAVYLPGYPEIDVKECLDFKTLDCFESNAMYREHHQREKHSIFKRLLISLTNCCSDRLNPSRLKMGGLPRLPAKTGHAGPLLTLNRAASPLHTAPPC
jgi:hypothetical protein